MDPDELRVEVDLDRVHARYRREGVAHRPRAVLTGHPRHGERGGLRHGALLGLLLWLDQYPHVVWYHDFPHIQPCPWSLLVPRTLVCVPAPDLGHVLQLKRAGDLDAAVIALEGILGAHPHPAALAQLADVQLRRGRFEEAAAALDRAEAEAGTTAFTARLRGDLAYREGRFRDAARSYQDADALGDRGTWTLVQLGRARLRLGDVAGARGAAAQAIERDDAATAAWTLLGDIERREGRLDVAETMYARALERSGEDQWAYAKLCEVRLLRLPPERRAKEAAVLHKSAGAANPHLTAVLARLRSEAGDEDAAAAAWQERAGRTGDRYARKMQGFALRRAGRLDEAAAVLGSCLLEDPHDLVLFKTYVHLQHRRGALEELRRTLEGLLPHAGSRRGAVYAELRKLPVPAPDAAGDAGAPPVADAGSTPGTP